MTKRIRWPAWPATRQLARAGACACAVVIAACATAGATLPGQGQHAQDAATSQPPPAADARGQPGIDAAVPHDAAVTPDAAAVTPDAAAGSGSGGQVCSDNTMCPDTGTCCWVLVCVPGQGLGSNLCFPN